MNQEPQQEFVLPQLYQEKIALVRAAADGGGEPAVQVTVEATRNPSRIFTNATELARPASPTFAAIHARLTGESSDVFDLYQEGVALVDASLHGMPRPVDIPDLLLTLYALNKSITLASADLPDSPALTQRGVALLNAIILAAVERTTFKSEDFQVIPYMMDVYEQMLGEQAIPRWPAIDALREAIFDRARIQSLIRTAQWRQEDYDAGNKNAYNQPLKTEAANEMNTHAAELVERLHLLKAYPVMPMEVKGERLGLPWDVAVVPPLQGLEGDYAEGAIADFILLVPDAAREDITFQIERTDDRGSGIIDVGDGQAVMRFRLHDDGSLTHGMCYHNVPNGSTERSFSKVGAEPAFIKLRSLLIGLAFDAVVPDDVVSDAEVGGSVSRALIPPGEREMQPHRLTRILLRRRRVLERAGVRPEQPIPQGWPRARTSKVKGYFMKLREGYRPRASAEEESRRWYRAHNLPYPGWQDDHTWVPPHLRPGSEPEITYRRAYFRPSSETKQHLGALGLRPRRAR